MIKKYLEFIKESELQDFNSLGEWVESLYDDEYVKNIVNRFLGDIHSTIRLSNAINTLEQSEQDDIKSQIDTYLQNGIEEKEPEILVSTEINESAEITIAGKSIFNSFLKSLTALGQKEKGSNVEKCPSHFLLFYYYPDLSSEDVKSVFGRFKSLTRYLDMIDYGKNECGLYFGIKCDGTFEYGVTYDKLNPIGQFKLTPSVVRWLVTIESKSAASLKKEIVNISHTDMLLLGKIKTDMKDFKPGYFEKESKPTISDKVISFGYYGIGKWDNGKLDEGELLNIKNNFTTWVMTKKWGQKVLISVKPHSFWLYVHIKLK